MIASDARTAYERFAAFYDDFTAGYEHGAWAGMLLDAAEAAGLRGRRLLDVACGTGESFLSMLDRGFEVTACDISPAMLAAARAKATGRAELLEHDMRALPRLGAFDLVWCLGDALNYLMTAGALRAAFGGMAANLARDGVLVFDVNTLSTFRDVYSSLRVRPGERQILLLDGHGAPDVGAGGEAEVWIDRLTPAAGGRWERCRTVHRHRHHPASTIERCLAANGLALAAVHGSSADGLRPGLDEDRHIKGVYIARHAHA